MSAAPEPALPLRRYAGRLLPLVVLWVALVGWLGWLLYARANWSRQADEADIREWLTETRVFRKTLPELVREYADAASFGGDPVRAQVKADEVTAHLAALAEPTRKYANKLPLFPEVYTLAVEFPDRTSDPGLYPEWRSPLPRPGGADAKTRLRELVLPVADGRGAVVRCEFRVHSNNRFEQEQEERRTWQIPLVLFLVPSTALAGWYVYRFFRRERDQARAAFAAEHRERELAEENNRVERRAAAAERSALELKSQLYASIGIMAGSYAHNIKNLLVRPNDLLARCLEADGMTPDQTGMLHEVKASLGTVNNRLQQLLRTVRQDPNRAERTRVDLAELVAETQRTWAAIAWDSWKVRLSADPVGLLVVNGDLSNLQQAVENLLFNARDATFEMRNHIREAARSDPALDPPARRQRLIDAAAWKGEVHLRAYADGGSAVLEVRDNGVGMSAEVRANCLTTHFTTKRDNALYKGYNSGSGLGLSFVAVVLEHHGATLDIESEPLRGTTFRVRLPLASE